MGFTEARKREREYHEKLYAERELFAPGSWLSKPVRYVLASLDHVVARDGIQVLDLGCGVGRNTIPLAKELGRNSSIVAVDLLGSAVDTLVRNAATYGVADRITPIAADVEHFEIPKNRFDVILSVSCIEHVSTKQAFIHLLERIRTGTRVNGVNCFMINTDITWSEATTGRSLKPVVELNLASAWVKGLLQETYEDWTVLDLSEKDWKVREVHDGSDILFKSRCVCFTVKKTRGEGVETDLW